MLTLPQPISVVCVHGTFAYADSGEADGSADSRWWQRQSPFHKDLERRLGESTPIELRQFHWSGDNSETARRAAAKLLLIELVRLEKLERPYYIIAHSHGGSVLWEALCALPEMDAKQSQLPHLIGWTTVGTPYLYFAPDLTRIWGVITVLALFVVTILQWPWLRDYWSATSSGIQNHWLHCLALLLYAQASAVFCTAMMLHLLFRIYRLGAAQRDREDNSAIPQHELRRFTQATKSCLVVGFLAAFILGVFYLTYVDVFLDIAAAFTVSRILVGVYVWCVLGLGYASLIGVAKTGWHANRGRLRKRFALESWKYFGERSSLVVCEDDEAINALANIVNGFDGPLLPRLSEPGAGQYSKRGWLLKPEQVSSSGIALPILIIRDWVMRPLYNEVFVAILDAYVLRQLSRQAHGSDVLGLSLGCVSNHPIVGTSVGNVKLWQRFVSYFLPISTIDVQSNLRFANHSDLEIRKRTDAAVLTIVAGIRREMRLPMGGLFSFRLFLENAMKGCGDVTRSLVHTQYFDEPTVQEFIAAQIVRCASKQPAKCISNASR